MKIFAVSIITCILICESVSAFPAHAGNKLSVGVRKGNWAEYNVVITGKPPPIHNITWMRMEVLQGNNDGFPVNLTVRYPNGTMYSSVWQFNFTVGNTEGWIIIPANLGVGDTFFDVFKKTGSNITIQAQTREALLGAIRTVTCGSDSLRQKEWDRATGVFVGSYEAFKNWTAEVNITATNLWSPDMAGSRQTGLYLLVGSVATCAVFAILTVLIGRKVLTKRRKMTLGVDSAC